MWSPSLNSPLRMPFATTVSNSRWMVRLSGRAPYTGSKPTSVRKSSAASLIVIVIRRSSRRPCRRCVSILTISLRFSLPRLLKMTCSSMRFKNSGLKFCFIAFVTRWRINSWSPGALDPFKSKISWLPMLLVKMQMVFLKLTLLPLLSVNRPSSSNCNMTLKTSGCAFSISSNNNTEYGFRRTASVSWPPSSYPTYPGGAPSNRETVCFSMYSLMSMRINASSESNMNSLKALQSSVFPTPVGPRKMKDAIGLVGSFKPALDRCTASVTT
mmetsp:Transcript_18106/g.51527  ORF Transcript_18106/g.51527 Transcript_18106/m.51527 type:complete len:270 (+) Transcript_18106:182-991(+)